MPPRINSQGSYTDEGTVLPDGSLRPYTPEELDATRAYESAAGLPSTLPAEPEATPAAPAA